jgi:ATP-dependent DNA helicase RecG
MTDPGDALRFLKGIGPARAEALERAGWHTVWDVLHHVPRLLGPPPPLCESGPLPPGAEVRVRARVVSVRPTFGRGRGVEAKLERSDGRPLKARFFAAGWLRRLLVPGEWFLFAGRADAERGDTLNHPSFERLARGLATPLPEEPGLRCAYPVPDGLSERLVQSLVAQVLASHLALARDPLAELAPADWQAALLALHRPVDADSHERARRILAKRELAAVAWTLQQRRSAAIAGPGRAWPWDAALHQRAVARLPFTLTEGQAAALAEIRADLAAPRPMYRLLSGDVGSGKTALALIACLVVVAGGGQTAILAPTGILADQHARFVRRCLAGSRVRVELLTAATPARERTAILAAVADGSCGMLIGTHAILNDGVVFRDLGLAVIDEQHRFGVAQRAALASKSAQTCDLLLMTATPIPRTLALTAFGDLAMSRIHGRPPGRAVVTTEVAVGSAVRLPAELTVAGQALIVCARKDETPEAPGAGAVPPADAATVHRQLTAHCGKDQVGLLTGDCSEDAKLAVLNRLRAGELRVLVSTTVVEVGIDVPTLTLLVVLDAERFGLAQLHQLRGRLGRGTLPGRAVLFAATPAGAERLAVLAQNDDGMAVAQADLANRGCGELLGLRQAGQWRLRVADLDRDLDLLQAAHAWAAERLGQGLALPAGLSPWLVAEGATAAAAG